MSYKTLLYSKESSFISPEERNIGMIKLNRPDALNALNSELLEELDKLLDDLWKDEEVRVLVVTGAGDKAFSAGADLKEAAAMSGEAAREFVELGQRVFRRIEDFDKPTISAINGLALGGGLELALSCDIRVASDKAKLGSPEVSIGLIPGWGGSQRLPKILGKGRAAELILTGTMIDAREAERIGLVNKVVPHDELMTSVNWIAGKIASNAPAAVRWAKKLINRSYELSIDEGNRLEAEAIAECLKTEDLKEGVRALFEKRSPRFKGK